MIAVPRRVVAVATVLTVALLAGCGVGGGGTSTGEPSSVVDQGYQSGDGTTKTWAVADRGEPITLSGTDFAGGAVDVATWRGDVVVLNTWYAACPPCRKEAPDLVQLAADFAADGVHFLGINGTDAAGAAQAYERTFAVTYPSIADTDGTAIAALQGAVLNFALWKALCCAMPISSSDHSAAVRSRGTGSTGKSIPLARTPRVNSAASASGSPRASSSAA